MVTARQPEGRPWAVVKTRAMRYAVVAALGIVAVGTGGQTSTVRSIHLTKAVLVAYTAISERGQYVVMLPATTPLRELGHRTVARERKPLRAGVPVHYFVEDFRVFRGVFFGVAPADDHVWLVRRNLATETAETQRIVDLGPVGSLGADRRGAIELIGSRLYVGTSSGLVGYDLDPVRAPTRVVNLQMPSPVVSIAMQVPGR